MKASIMGRMLNSIGGKMEASMERRLNSIGKDESINNGGRRLI
jgi:hypothetical protein